MRYCSQVSGGCGKTYIIENDFKHKMENKAKILRISLFGISSADEIHRNIKLSYIETILPMKTLGMIGKALSKIKKQAASIDALPSWIKSIAAIDGSDFITVPNKIGEESVVLVFDDLERCNMCSSDVLGVINEYCENRKFHTIIVANQEKLLSREPSEKVSGEICISSLEDGKSADNKKKLTFSLDKLPQSFPEKIPYQDIKEKIIHRTVYYSPDYVKIVNNVIDNAKYPDDKYKSFVESCRGGLVDLFIPEMNGVDTSQIEKAYVSDGERFKRPHNIRSLKCAIYDFYRVYKLLKENSFDELEKWFYSFVSYVISYKAGIAKEGDYGTIFTDEEVKLFYPAYKNDYMLDGVKKWILHGVWNNNSLNHEIKQLQEKKAAKKPSEIIRTHRIMYVDEDVINQGFSEFLENLYAGKYSLDDYVLFIENSCWAKRIEYKFPIDIDWDEVLKGATKCIKRYKDKLPEGQLLYNVISEDNREHFTDKEWKVYKIISDFAIGDGAIFFRNRKLYIDKFSEYASDAFIFVQNKRFDIFDEEMADITAQAFSKDNNNGKSCFASSFRKMWELNVQSADFKIDISLTGFEKLHFLLNKQYSEYKKQGKQFAAYHTDKFIKAIDNIIVICKQQIEKTDSDK